MNELDIVVADDDAVALRLLERQLVKAGYKVHPCDNGDDALELVVRKQPVVLLTDWKMPGLTGLELCRKIRETQSDTAAYIILQTSNDQPEQVVAGFQAGVDDYVTKPVHSTVLLARVRAGVRLLRAFVDRESQAVALGRRAKEARLLREVLDIAGETGSFEETLQKEIDLICETIGWPVGHVYVPSQDGRGDLEPTDIWHLDEPFDALVAVTMKTRFSSGVGLPGRVLASKLPAWIADVQKNDNFPRARLADDIGVKGALGVPIKIGREIVAVLEFFSRQEMSPDGFLLSLMHSLMTPIGRAFERRRVQEQLQLQSVALESAADAIVITDRDGDIEYVNPAFVKNTGYTAEEVIGQNPRVLKSGKQDEAFYRNLWETILSGKVWQGEIVNRCKDGSLYPEETSITPVRNADGLIVRFVAIKRDISDRKRAEAALHESEEMFRCISTSAQDAIIMMDSDGNISYWNKAAERIFGYRQEEVIGKCLHSQAFIVPEQLREAHFRAWPKFQETGQGAVTGRTVEVAGIRKNGEEFPVELSLSAVRMKGRWHSISVLRDVTGRKRAEADRQKRAEIEQERNHLRDAVKAQERLLGVVGHELRTPLAGVRAIAELLIDEDSRDMAEFDTFLRNIHDEVVRMSGLVNDLLEVARMHSGVAQWNWSEVSLRDAGEAAMSAVRPLIDHDRVKLILDVQPGDLTMRGDKDAIRRLVLNLVNNACKNTAEGSVCVTVRALEKDGLGHVEIEVRDTGAGMTAEVARRLGQAFALNSGVVGDSHVKGSGLGLAICRGIVAAHGGSISVNTVQGAGSVFSALLRSDLPEPMTPEKETEILCEVS